MNKVKAMIDKYEIKKIFSEDLESGFAHLEELLNKESAKINDFLVLFSRYNQLKKENRNGILSRDDYTRESNQIRLGVFGLIEEISEVDIIFQYEDTTEERRITNYKKNPRIELELIPDGGIKRPLGLSRNNEVDENGAVWITKAIYINELKWKYKLMVRNNSTLPAFNPELILPKKVNLHFLSSLNSSAPIGPLEEKEIDIIHQVRIESTGSHAVELIRNKYPERIKNLEILVKYLNEEREPLFTLFKVNGGNQQNEIISGMPEYFK